VGLAKARLELQTHRAGQAAAMKGEADHPVIAARFARKAAIAAPTVAELFDQWVADKRLGSPRKGGMPVRERTITILRQNFDADIRNRIGDAKVAKLTREAVQSCIDAPRRRGAPASASQVYRTLKGLVTFGIRRGYIDAIDPMRGIDNPRPYRPAPVIAANDLELLALLRTVDTTRLHEATKLAIEFQLLTGARPSEVRLMKTAELDINRALWTIPAERFKSDREHRIHLSARALSILERARLIRGTSAYVFAGAKSEDPQSSPMDQMAVARALARLAPRIESAGGKRLRPHDLRRTFRTMLSRIGVAPHIAELCLGHIEKETMRRVYDGYDYRAEMADAWDRAGAHIAALRAGGGKVIELRRVRT
jgi:integrase